MSSYVRLRNAAKRVGPLRSAWHLALAAREALRYSSARQRARFNREFERSADPWDYATNPPQKERHRRESEMLDAVRGNSRFGNALEVGCAEGIFTEILAERCDSLLAVDISAVALARARARRVWDERVRFAEWDLGREAVPGAYDLITAVHVLECIGIPLVLRKARTRLVDGLQPGGYLLVGCTGGYDPVVARAWWGRYLPRDGSRIVEFIGRHPALKVVDTLTSRLSRSVSYDVLFQRVT